MRQIGLRATGHGQAQPQARARREAGLPRKDEAWMGAVRKADSEPDQARVGARISPRPDAGSHRRLNQVAAGGSVSWKLARVISLSK
ncbi:hypothetical protein SAMN05216359_107164 [Roseateles sp. YR242]|nr:hypothetical protein SAMN05216359_107164 [Roseateles sp. YR242]